jgi:hypothetical protein
MLDLADRTDPGRVIMAVHYHPDATEWATFDQFEHDDLISRVRRMRDRSTSFEPRLVDNGMRQSAAMAVMNEAQARHEREEFFAVAARLGRDEDPEDAEGGERIAAALADWLRAGIAAQTRFWARELPEAEKRHMAEMDRGEGAKAVIRHRIVQKIGRAPGVPETDLMRDCVVAEQGVPFYRSLFMSEEELVEQTTPATPPTTPPEFNWIYSSERIYAEASGYKGPRPDLFKTDLAKGTLAHHENNNRNPRYVLSDPNLHEEIKKKVEEIKSRKWNRSERRSKP